MDADNVTALLQSASAGDAKALRALFSEVYDQLKRIAHQRLAASNGYSLNTTGLVHEAYMKLVQSDASPLNGRLNGQGHFFALAARAMRQIVIDHARKRASSKRGGNLIQRVDLEAAADVPDSELGPHELLRLNRALELLEASDPELAQLVEMRFFAGLNIAEIATLKGLSERTLNRQWRYAKAQLYTALNPEL
jgi:RNA polymerase sigma factor (TIGR02999 family)